MKGGRRDPTMLHMEESTEGKMGVDQALKQGLDRMSATRVEDGLEDGSKQERAGGRNSTLTFFYSGSCVCVEAASHPPAHAYHFVLPAPVRKHASPRDDPRHWGSTLIVR
ncbi:hypothetical protein GGTG_10827 [Gaeumannomyces tritici R3-111a-1]|uniref:Uncharacterized protein n=1 Tax=Gaeumannomyces tritici (strain R3-111a-1) TaxID=644352 RepID=J3PBF4_GAET3|nr:hypothetical protein GGTG_10827 [Gaeumannomyces tritici R3-111a-1]EJT71571.1 hypothetical protein GGTG_10827 [Gaeumannomyces tritici R3-111a-1]